MKPVTVTVEGPGVWALSVAVVYLGYLILAWYGLVYLSLPAALGGAVFAFEAAGAAWASTEAWLRWLYWVSARDYAYQQRIAELRERLHATDTADARQVAGLEGQIRTLEQQCTQLRYERDQWEQEARRHRVTLEAQGIGWKGMADATELPNEE